MDERTKQVARQCRAAKHLATQIADLYDSMYVLFVEHGADNLVDVIGKRSARHMDELGDMLSSMDAVTDDDEWLNPIFEKAREAWPDTLQ